ncbi:MAG: beta-ketoacyl synthase N-terminal-like domain-containing protein [Chloroflexota bacterium]
MTGNTTIPTSNHPIPKSDVQKEPIAIIGIGCRFPGGADNPEKFWQLLVNEVDAITDIPSERVDVARYYVSIGSITNNA